MSAARRYSVVSVAIGIFVGARIMQVVFFFVTASIPPFFSLLLIQGFTPFHKLPDSSLPLLFPPFSNRNKPVYGFCDFLVLFLFDT
ncbi:TPA: hypothetical protein UON59_003924, partial [Clostridioides difficile]|nr:hypothetical protein [Clostridioides difficile]